MLIFYTLEITTPGNFKKIFHYEKKGENILTLLLF